MQERIGVQELENLVVVFSGVIQPWSKVDKGDDMVDIGYTLPESLGSYKTHDLWSAPRLRENGFELRQNSKINLGVVVNQEGKSYLVALKEIDVVKYQEPKTEVEKLNQKLALLRMLTENKYKI